MLVIHQEIMLNIKMVSRTNLNKYIVVVFEQLLHHSIIKLSHKMYLLQPHMAEISQMKLSRNLVSILQKINAYLLMFCSMSVTMEIYFPPMAEDCKKGRIFFLGMRC